MRAAPNPRLLVGSFIALSSALTFALSLALVDWIYASGGNIHSLNLVRAVAFALAMLMALAVVRRSVRASPRQLVMCAGLGLLFCVEMYGVLGAIHFIPVGLAILLMYIYPMIVAILSWITGQESFTLDRLLALLAAFAGLALALQSPFGLVDWRGAALGFTSALSFAGLVFLSERVMRDLDRRAMMFYLNVVAILVIGALLLVVADLQWPQSPRGWSAFGASTVLYVFATALLFTAIHFIGPLNTAMIDNSTPVWAIVFAALLLDERLSAVQLFGGALVIGAVVLLQVGQRVPD